MTFTSFWWETMIRSGEAISHKNRHSFSLLRISSHSSACIETLSLIWNYHMGVSAAEYDTCYHSKMHTYFNFRINHELLPLSWCHLLWLGVYSVYKNKLQWSVIKTVLLHPCGLFKFTQPLLVWLPMFAGFFFIITVVNSKSLVSAILFWITSDLFPLYEINSHNAAKNLENRNAERYRYQLSTIIIENFTRQLNTEVLRWFVFSLEVNVHTPIALIMKKLYTTMIQVKKVIPRTLSINSEITWMQFLTNEHLLT